MRTVSVVLCIVFALGTLVFFEVREIKGFCSSVRNISEELQTEIECKGDCSKNIYKLNNIWESKKNLLYMFANHNSFKDIENEIFNIEIFMKRNDNAKALYHTEKLIDKIDELREISRFDLSNIL